MKKIVKVDDNSIKESVLSSIFDKIDSHANIWNSLARRIERSFVRKMDGSGFTCYC